MKKVVSIVTALLVLGLAVSAEAQDRGPREHKGFWISFGLGGGWNLSKGLDGESLAGGAGFLRMGGSVTSQILVGGEAIGWGTSKDDRDIGRGNTTLTVMYYPSPKGGAYVKVGLGFASLTSRVSTTVGNTTTSTTETKGGFGTTLGAGYDIRLARNFYLSPTVDWLFQAFGETANGTSTNNVILITVGFTWH